jgi:hypothetical protein
MHMAGGGGMHRGGRGDARASCASPLGTPLSIAKIKLSGFVILFTYPASQVGPVSIEGSRCPKFYISGTLSKWL